MAKGNKANVQIFTNARLPRIVARITRSLECSSPAPGRPRVWGTEGINWGIVREHWPTGDLDEPNIFLNRDFQRAFGYDENPTGYLDPGILAVLDENVDTGEIVHRWQNAGCDPRNIAISIHRYVMTYSLILSRTARSVRRKLRIF